MSTMKRPAKTKTTSLTPIYDALLAENGAALAKATASADAAGQQTALAMTWAS